MKYKFVELIPVNSFWQDYHNSKHWQQFIDSNTLVNILFPIAVSGSPIYFIRLAMK